jgi:hypothetical protein
MSEPGRPDDFVKKLPKMKGNLYIVKINIIVSLKKIGPKFGPLVQCSKSK